MILKIFVGESEHISIYFNHLQIYEKKHAILRWFPYQKLARGENPSRGTHFWDDLTTNEARFKHSDGA